MRRLSILQHALVLVATALAATPVAAPGYEANCWLAIVVPGGTPAQAIARLNAELTRALSLADIRDGFAKGGLEPAPSTPAEMGELLRSDFQKWGTIIRERGIKSG